MKILAQILRCETTSQKLKYFDSDVRADRWSSNEERRETDTSRVAWAVDLVHVSKMVKNKRIFDTTTYGKKCVLRRT